jgi:transcription elongation factor Elf1
LDGDNPIRRRVMQLGKRHFCEECGTEVLVTKASKGTMECCGKEMQLKEPKPLPSSD